MLKLAMIGLGWAGSRQIEAIRELNRKVEVVCLSDNDAQFLQAKAQEFHISKTAVDYREVLADDEVDAVSICTPHHLHVDIVLAAAAAGKHILCEKPLALTVAEATRMIEAAEKNNVQLYVAENESYQPLAHFLREVVQTKATIGDITAVTLTTGFRAENFGYPGRRAWLTQPAQGGTGTWLLHGIHSMAQLRRIFGEVETVYAQEHKTGSFARQDLEGTVSGTLTMTAGFHINFIQTSETKIPANVPKYVILGEKGIIRAFADGCEILLTKENHQPQFVSYPACALSTYAQEIEAFADTVAGTAVGPTTGRSERRTLAVVEAGYESMKHGRAVNLKDHFGDI